MFFRFRKLLIVFAGISVAGCSALVALPTEQMYQTDKNDPAFATITVTRDTGFAGRGLSIYLFDQRAFDSAGNGILGVWADAFLPRHTYPGTSLPDDARRVAYLSQLSKDAKPKRILWDLLYTKKGDLVALYEPHGYKSLADLPSWLKADSVLLPCLREITKPIPDQAKVKFEVLKRFNFRVDHADLISALTKQPSVSFSYTISKLGNEPSLLERDDGDHCRFQYTRDQTLTFIRGTLVGSINHKGVLRWSRPPGQVRISMLLVSPIVNKVITILLNTERGETRNLVLEQESGFTLTENGKPLSRFLGTL